LADGAGEEEGGNDCRVWGESMGNLAFVFRFPVVDKVQRQIEVEFLYPVFQKN
jgi:hypothetical protein